jgi:hypothetical protein
MRGLAASLALVVVFAGTSCRREPLDEVARGYVELIGAFENGQASASRARELLDALEGLPGSSRAAHLKRQLEAVAAAIEIRDGRKVSFDDESRLLFGVTAPEPNEDEGRRIRAELEGLLEGDEPLAQRYAAFQRRFAVPEDRVDAVLRRALEESRRRTRAHLALPDGEGVSIEYVAASPWPSFCSYRGAYRSAVIVNREVPLTIASAVEIATHEAYPGHHTTSVLLDRDFVRGEGLIELSVEPPVGPDALVREGLSQYGIELAFPEEDRERFERETLVPLAGLSVDATDLARYRRVEELVHRLAPFAVDGARQYIDRKRDRVASAIWLESEALIPDAWAFLRFVDRYRTFVLTYTLGGEMVRKATIGRGSDPWRAYVRLLSPSEDAT